MNSKNGEVVKVVGQYAILKTKIATPHKTIILRDSIEIDTKMVPLISLLWEMNITTTECCESEPWNHVSDLEHNYFYISHEYPYVSFYDELDAIVLYKIIKDKLSPDTPIALEVDSLRLFSHEQIKEVFKILKKYFKQDPELKTFKRLKNAFRELKDPADDRENQATD